MKPSLQNFTQRIVAIIKMLTGISEPTPIPVPLAPKRKMHFKVAASILILVNLFFGSTSFGQVTQLNAWTQQYGAVGYPSGAVNPSYAIPNGTDRILVVAVATTRTATGTITCSGTYGGVALTASTANDGTVATLWNHTFLFYMLDANIGSAAGGKSLNITCSGGTAYYTTVSAAVYTGVNQTTPTTDNKNFNGTNTSSDLVGPINLNLNANDRGISVVNLARGSTGTTSRTISTFQTNWSTASYTSSTISTDGPCFKSYVIPRSVLTAATNEAGTHTASSQNTYKSYSALSLKPAAPTITSFSTSSGCVGSSLTINGTNLAGATAVTIGGTTATIQGTPTSTAVTVTVGSGTTGTVTVTSAGGSVTSGATFTVNPVPGQTITAPSNVCANSTGNTASVTTSAGGSYAWTITNGTITSATNIQAITFTAGASGSVTLNCVVTSSTGCASAGGQNQSITINAPTVNVGSALSAICQGGTSAALGGSIGGSATGGTWSTPAGGTFAPNATTLNATWTPPVGFSGTATLTLTTSGGSCGTATASKNQVVVAAAPASAAGPDQTVCIGAVTLAANAATPGTGAWTILAGSPNTSSAQLNSTSNEAAIFTPTASGNYTLRWTISNAPCTATTDDVVITVNAPTASAGSALSSICQGGTSAALGGTIGGTATGGTWSTAAGGTFTPDATTLNATWTPPAGFSGTAALTLTTSGGSCGTTTASKNQVVVAAAPASAAGPDQTVCIGAVTLAANAATPGTGAWTILAGSPNTSTAQLNSTSNAAATFTPTASGTYTLRWTVSNAPCAPTTDDVVITVNAPTASPGSALNSICQGGTSAALGGIIGGTATGGTWSTPAGGTFNPDATTLNATWTPPAGFLGTATLTLTTSGGSCGTTTASKTQVVTTNTWLGTTSNDWFIASNWCGGVPTSATDVVIPSGGNQPTIGTVGAVCNNLTINASATLTLGASGGISVAGAFTKTGTLTADATSTFSYAQASGNQTLVANNYGNLTLSGGGTKTFPGGTVGIAGTFTPNTFTTAAAGTIDFNGSSSQTIPAFNYNNLTSSSTGARTLSGSGTIGVAATFTAGSNTYTSSGSTVNYNGTASVNVAVLTGGNFNNLTFSGSGTYTFAANNSIGGSYLQSAGAVVFNTTGSTRTITVTGNFTQNGGTIDFGTGAGNTNINLSGNLSVTGASTMTTSGNATPNGTFVYSSAGVQTLSFATPANITYVNHTVNNGATLRLLTGVQLSRNNTAAFRGTILVNNGGTIDCANQNVTSQLTGTNAVFTISSGAKMITANATGVQGSVTTTNITASFSSAADYEFQGAATGLFTTTPTALTVNNLTKSVAGTTTMSQNFTVNGTLTLTSGVLDASGRTVTMQTANTLISRGTGTLTVNTSTNLVFGTTGNLGGAAFTIPDGTFTSAPSISSFTINRTNGLTLGNQALTVNGTLTLTSGLITPTGSGTLTIASTTGLSGGSASSYVIGDLRRAVAANVSTVAFPIGDAGKYTPVSLTFATGNAAGNVTASTAVPGLPPALGDIPSGSGIDQSNYINRNWTLAFSATPNYTATFTYNTAVTSDVIGSPSLTALRVGKNTAGVWSNPTGSSTSPSATTSAGLTSGGIFSLGGVGVPTINPSTNTFSAFTTTYGTASAAQTVAVTGANLSANITATAATNFEVANDGATYGATTTFTNSGGAASGTLSIRLKANAPVSASYNAITAVSLTSTGATQRNYTTAGTGNSVTAQGLTIVGAITADKVYDGTNTASVTGGSLVGVVGSDVVTLTQSGTFAQSTVGTGIAITSTSTIGGADVGNYSLTQPSLTARDITARPLSINDPTVTKLYDGTTAAGTATLGGTVSNNVAGETPSVSVNTVSAYSASDVASNYNVTVSYALTDNSPFLAANYSLANSNINNASITPASLTITADNQSKCSGTLLTFTGTEFTNTALQNSETIGSVTLTSAGASAGAAAGTYSIVASTATGGSFNPSNYTISYVDGTLTVNQTPAITNITDAICSGSTFSVTPANGVNGVVPTGTTTYTWSVLSVTGGGLSGDEAGSGASITGTLTLSGAAAATVTYTVTPVSAAGCTGNSFTVEVTVNPNPINPTISPFLPADLDICEGGSVVLTSSAATGNQWYKDGLPISGETGTTYTATAAGDYSVLINLSGCVSDFTEATVTVSTNQWISSGIGSQDRNWNNGANWSCGTPPPSGASAIISTGATLFPQLPTGVNPVLNNLTLPSPKTIEIQNQTLTINGTITGTGTLTGSNTSSLVIGGTALGQQLNFTPGGTDNFLKNLTINSGATATLGNALNITSYDGVSAAGTGEGVLTVAGTGVLTTGGNLTIKSGEFGTARIASNLTSSSYISGAVTVERFIPLNATRAYRLLTAPTSGQTIKQSWQEGQTALTVGTNNVGTQVTGNFTNTATAQALGFDEYTPGTSMFSYNPGTNAYDRIDNTNTKLIDSVPGWLVYIRGDRRDGKTVSTIHETTLRTKGTIKMGSQVSANVVAGQYAVVANPYASAIDLTQLTMTGGTEGGVITVWDPKIGTTGGYVNLTPVGSPVVTGYLASPAANGYSSYNSTIQSGQAFFVQAGSSDGTVTIGENSKVGGSTRQVFRPATPAGVPQRFFADLYSKTATSKTILDGIFISLDDAHSNGIDNFDGRKQNNFVENLGMKLQGVNLAVEKRKPFIATDTVFFNTTSLRKTTYQLAFKTENLDANLVAMLEDRYLNTKTLVNSNGTSTYDFTVDNNGASSAADRFRVVFKEIGAGTLPVTFVSIKAAQQNNNIAVEWKVGSQLNIAGYDVERSADGRNFTKMATVAASNTDLYNWLDVNAPQGINFYRIKATDLSGEFRYTTVVKVNISKSGATVTASPNPVTGNNFTLQFTNQPAGKYKVSLYSADGQLMYSNSIQHNGGSLTQSVNLKNSVVSGVYELQIAQPGKTIHSQKLIVDRK